MCRVAFILLRHRKRRASIENSTAIRVRLRFVGRMSLESVEEMPRCRYIDAISTQRITVGRPFSHSSIDKGEAPINVVFGNASAITIMETRGESSVFGVTDVARRKRTSLFTMKP